MRCHEIEFVKQLHTRGCGPAALAMLTSQPYACVCEYFGGDFNENGIYFTDLANYLADHGFALATWKRFVGRDGGERQERKCWPVPPSGFPELCHVQVLESSPVSHFCVRTAGGEILDPLIGKNIAGLASYFCVNSISAVCDLSQF